VRDTEETPPELDEGTIRELMDLGMTRDEAEAALEFRKPVHGGRFPTGRCAGGTITERIWASGMPAGLAGRLDRRMVRVIS
jgi:hypothetical protein